METLPYALPAKSCLGKLNTRMDFYGLYIKNIYLPNNSGGVGLRQAVQKLQPTRFG
jgi:hypothetical protein